MALLLHRAERADVLVDALAHLLQGVRSDPFQPDVVAVPSRGVERWIAQSLSTSLGTQPGRMDGVCANVAFPSPDHLVGEALAAAAGITVDEDPWGRRRLPWPLLDVIDDCAGEAWCRTLGRHLGLAEGGLNRGRRMAVAQKLANLFTRWRLPATRSPRRGAGAVLRHGIPDVATSAGWVDGTRSTIWDPFDLGRVSGAAG